jgi:hypothetical protein
VAHFEVYLPEAPPALPAPITLRVEAAQWLAALKAGLARCGLEAPPSYVLCDVAADGAIHVTDPDSGRVLRIEELAPGAHADPLPEPDLPAAAAARVEVAKGPVAPPAGPIGRPLVPVGSGALVSSVIDRAAGIHAAKDARDALALCLDLAMEATRAEAGAALVVEPGATDLRFVATRGPRAAEVIRLGARLPIGVGLAGFSAQERVCVAVSDASSHPRWFRGIADAVGYAARSVLCAPASFDGEVLGVLQVLNREGGVPFGPTDVTVVSYLASRAGEWLAKHPVVE